MMMRKTSVDADADARSARKRRKKTTMMRKTSADAAVADAKSAKKPKGATTRMTTNVDDVADAVVGKTIQTMLTPTMMKRQSKAIQSTFYNPTFIHTQEGERATLFSNR